MNNIIDFSYIGVILLGLSVLVVTRLLVKELHRTNCARCGDKVIIGKHPRLVDPRGDIHFACGSYCARRLKERDGFEELPK